MNTTVPDGDSPHMMNGRIRREKDYRRSRRKLELIMKFPTLWWNCRNREQHTTGCSLHCPYIDYTYREGRNSNIGRVSANAGPRLWMPIFWRSVEFLVSLFTSSWEGFLVRKARVNGSLQKYDVITLREHVLYLSNFLTLPRIQENDVYTTQCNTISSGRTWQTAYSPH